MRNRFIRRKSSPLVMLQLTAFIDVFSLIIFFLIKGTYLTDVPVYFEKGVAAPMSYTMKDVKHGPRIVLNYDNVEFPEIGVVVPRETFRQALVAKDADRGSELIKIDAYISSIVKLGADKNFFYFLAHKGSSYRDVYDTIEALRHHGVNSIFFLAESLGESQL